MSNDIYTIIFIIIVILSILMPIVFFRGSRKNIRIMKAFSEALEDVLKPKDKEYVLLGTYVGFRALYKINKGGINRAEVVLILLPRQSLIYYPFSKLFTLKHDKFLIKVELLKPCNTKFGIERKLSFCKESGLKVSRLDIRKNKFYYCEIDLNKLMILMNNIKNINSLSKIICEDNILFIEFYSGKSSIINDVMTILHLLLSS